MKITAVFLLIATLHVSASGVSQTISFRGQDVPLERVFSAIEEQTPYVVYYMAEDLKNARPVTLNAKQLDLNEFLKLVLKNQSLTFSIKGKTISVRTKPAVELNQRLSLVPPPITVRGRIVNEKGEPVTAASITVVGTNKGTVTDANGAFTLINVQSDAVLTVSGISIEQQRINVNNRTDITITVTTKIGAEEEVIINGGYYKTSDRLKTGSIEKVSEKEIRDQPVTSPLLSLQGRMAGVDVSPNSGIPGSGPSIKIRGQNSLAYNGAYPLYVIDGVPVDSRPIESSSSIFIGEYDPLSTINPASIESIEILKDADATAIYGSRGANGVVLITTKNANKGKTSTNLDIYRGVGKLMKKIELLNTEQYLELRREAFKNNNNQAMTESNAPDFKVWDTTRYTDWQEVLLGGTSQITDVNIGISGGNGTTSFQFSGGYHKETTIFMGDFNFQRVTGSFSLNHVSRNNKFRATFSANYGITKNSLFDAVSPVSNAFSLPPNAPALYNEDGSLNWGPNSLGGSSWRNPLAEYRRTNDSKMGNVIFNSTLTYNVVRGLNAKLNLGFTDLAQSEIIKVPLSSYPPSEMSFNFPSSIFSYTFRRSWIIEPQLSYSRSFGSHGFELLAGTTFQDGSNEYKRIDATGYASDGLLGSLESAATTKVYTDQNTQYRYTSAFARLGYDYRKKYIINLTGRRDGSSRFGTDNRFGNFGSIGAAWIFSKENLIINKLSFLSFGKLRGSFGIAGNDQIGDYRYFNTYRSSGGTYTGIAGLSPTSLYNPTYKWEANKKIETAIEFSFFRNRVFAEIAWYRNRTSNQLTDYTLPGTAGFNTVLQNLDAIIENKGWEYSLNIQALNRKNINWNISANYSRPRNELVKFDELQNSPYADYFVVGEPLAVQKFYKYSGVDAQTGLYTFFDADSNGIISFDDMTIVKSIGRTYFGGISNIINFKGIELSFLFQFAKQTSTFFRPGNIPGRLTNLPVAYYANRWQKPGDVSDYQKLSSSGLFASWLNYHSSDKTIKNSSFIRLKTITLSYSLRPVLLNKLNIQSLRIYFQGQNLLTITDFYGFDPETGSTVVPSLKMMTIGLQVGI